MIIAMLLCGSLVLQVSAANSWSKPRPSAPKDYYDKIGNFNNNDDAAIGMGVHIFHYHEAGVPDDNDYLRFRVSASANTRIGIEYEALEEDYNYNWYDVSESTGITGDDEGAWVELGFTLLFYGVEYYRVWVCSNGFLCLDSENTSSSPPNIPDTERPNSTIAVFWRDLVVDPNEGSSITCGNIGYYFVISWNNVLNKGNGNLQTFQVAIQIPTAPSDFHNAIYFQYGSITKDEPTTVGVEDQTGNKGTSHDPNNLHSGARLRFWYSSVGYRLNRLTIKLSKSADSDAMLDYLENYIAGYNVLLENYENPYGEYYALAIGYAAGLFLPEVGLIWNQIVILVETGDILSADLSKPDFDAESADPSENEAYVTALCRVENRSMLKPFDSTLADTFEWSFLDPNDESHYLTITAELSYQDLSSGDYYTIATSVTLNMYISGGGGGCPFLRVWDGQKYVIDNNLLPTSEAGNGTDVKDYYRLEQELVPRYEDYWFSWYPLQLCEFENEHSHFDQVKLTAVNHDSATNIAVTPDGEILTYREPHAPSSCIDNIGHDQLSEILHMDGNVSDPTTYFYGETGDYLVLNFGLIDSEHAKLILRDDMKCPLCCIEVQVLSNNDEWQTVTVLAPRAYWSIEAVNLSPYIIEDQEFMVRLAWTTPHRLDYVGLDTTEQDDYELHQATLVSAIHSTQGNVRWKLIKNDGKHAELIPDEQIQLLFRLPNNERETRTFILYTEGHYYTIT